MLFARRVQGQPAERLCLSRYKCGLNEPLSHSSACPSPFARRSASMLCAASPAAAMASRCRCTAPSAACTSQPRHPAASSSRARARSSCAARLRALPRLAAARSDATAGPAEDAASELPLWRHLRQCEGFSEDSIARMRGKKTRVTGTRYSQQKVERDLVPTIADLRAEGLDTTTIERLFVQRPDLLNTTRDTFSSALDALRPLAALVVPASAHAVQAPEGATELGVALFLYPTAAARLLTHTNLASLIDGNLRLRRQLGISDAETVHAAFKNHAVLVPDIDRAATKVAHLQGLHVSGKLSAEEGVLPAVRRNELACRWCLHFSSPPPCPDLLQSRRLPYRPEPWHWSLRRLTGAGGTAGPTRCLSSASPTQLPASKRQLQQWASCCRRRPACSNGTCSRAWR